MVDSEDRSHSEETAKLHEYHPHGSQHQGGVLGIASGITHVLEDALVASSMKRHHSTDEDMTPEERYWRQVAEEERKHVLMAGSETSPGFRADINPVHSATEKTTSSSSTSFPQKPDSKPLAGRNPEVPSAPQNQEDMNDRGKKLEDKEGHALRRDSHPPSSGMKESSIPEEERPALEQFDRALEKLTGVYNNASMVTQDIHGHPETRKHVRRSKSESQPVEGEVTKDAFEDALDKLSSAYGSSHIRAEDRQDFKPSERPRFLSERDAREQFDEALNKLTAPFNSTRTMAEDSFHHTTEAVISLPKPRSRKTSDAREQFDEALDKLTAPYNSTRIMAEDSFRHVAVTDVPEAKPRSRKTSENKDYFEDAIHKLTAVFGSSSLQAEDVTQMVEQIEGPRVPPATPPAAEGPHHRTPLDDALDRLQDTLHKGIHMEDMPNYNWSKEEKREFHPITDAAKDMVAQGAEKMKEMGEKGMEKTKEAADKAKEMLPGMPFGEQNPEKSNIKYADASDFDEEEEERDRYSVESTRKHTQKPTGTEPKTFFAGNQKLQVGDMSEGTASSPPKRGIFSKITGMLFGKREQSGTMQETPHAPETPHDHDENIKKVTSDDALILT